MRTLLLIALLMLCGCGKEPEKSYYTSCAKEKDETVSRRGAPNKTSTVKGMEQWDFLDGSPMWRVTFYQEKYICDVWVQEIIETDFQRQ